MINWISIDNVTYHWDGNNTITSETDNGFSSTLLGNSLDGLDILDPEGSVVGGLFVDFSQESISYRSDEPVLVNQIISYGVNEQFYSAPISEFMQLTDVVENDILTTDHHDLWLDIAYESQANINNELASSLSVDSLLFPPEQSLDIFLSPAQMQMETPSKHDNGLPIDVNFTNLNNSADPLDMLLTFNANAHYY
jgi:hypothetical protein